MSGKLLTSERNELLRLSWPLLAETLLVMLIGNVSTILLAAFSDDAAGSISVANQVVAMFHLVFMIVSTGAGILMAQYVGAKLYEKTARLGGMAIFVAFLLGVLGTIVLSVFAETFLSWLNLEGTFLAYGKTYALITAAGFAVQAVSFSMSQIIFSHGYTKVGLVASIFANVVNLGVNYLLIFGVPGLRIPALGVAGAAIGGLVARLVYFSLLAIFLLRSIDVKVSFRIFRPFPKEILGDILKVGAPSVAENLSYTGSQLVITGFVAVVGTVAVTTKSYYETIAMFTWATAASIAGGTTIMVGHHMGAGEPDRAVRVVRFSRTVGLISTLFVSSLLIFTIGPLGGLFTDNPEIIRLMKTIVFVDIFLQLARSQNMVVGTSLKATGDTRFPLYLALVVQWTTMIPVAYLLCFTAGLGLAGIWIAIALDELLRAIFLTLRWRRGKWKTLSLVRRNA
ncbi:MAG: MATE family efflux transporter [Candidatus Izemoplasmatales bacterium]